MFHIFLASLFSPIEYYWMQITKLLTFQSSICKHNIKQIMSYFNLKSFSQDLIIRSNFQIRIYPYNYVRLHSNEGRSSVQNERACFILTKSYMNMTLRKKKKTLLSLFFKKYTCTVLCCQGSFKLNQSYSALLHTVRDYIVPTLLLHP